MAQLWPWLAVAGLGALHGLHPASGWMFAAAWGLRAGGAAQVRWALAPIALGQAASIALVAVAVLQGLSMDRARLLDLAGALLVGAAAWRLLRDAAAWRPAKAPVGPRRRPSAGPTGLALWSFLVAAAQGTGLMLVPALMPLCLGPGTARAVGAPGSLGLALAAAGVHMAAMLLTTGLVAAGVCRGVARCPRLASGALPGRAWTAALALTGALLLAPR